MRIKYTYCVNDYITIGVEVKIMIKDLPQKLKDIRLKYGYSQKYVAAKLDVSPSIISGYETGERTPSTESLLALSYLYNCSADYLLGKEKETPSVFINADGLSDNQINAIKILINSIRNN